MGTFSGVPIIRTIVVWGQYWGPCRIWAQRCRVWSLGSEDARFKVNDLGCRVEGVGFRI